LRDLILSHLIISRRSAQGAALYKHLLFIALAVCFAPRVHAQNIAPDHTLNAITNTEDIQTSVDRVPNGLLLNSTRVAQVESDDAYDPFADYSEFEESADEEADLNFFRNGRSFTLAMALGYRGFTDTFAQIYTGAPIFGVYITYFFDLRFAMAIGFFNSDHQMYVQGPTESIVGNVNLQDLAFHIKYFINTQNITRGLSDLNPYFMAGFSEVFRTIKVSGQTVYAQDSATGFDLGGGLEIPIMRKKMYFGIEGFYQIINFSDSNSVILQSDGVTSTGVTPRGNSWIGMGLLGVNF
jgi:hypothetical protein